MIRGRVEVAAAAFLIVLSQIEIRLTETMQQPAWRCNRAAQSVALAAVLVLLAVHYSGAVFRTYPCLIILPTPKRLAEANEKKIGCNTNAQPLVLYNRHFVQAERYPLFVCTCALRA